MASLLDSLVNNQPQAPQNMGLLAQLTSQPQAELRSYSPPLRQRILDYLIGDNRPSQAKSSFMQGLVGISDWTPIGAAYALDDMQRSLRAGDQQGAQLAALGVVPGIRPAGKIAQKVAGAVEREIPQGIRAYHGSPHDFDKFDLSKIGTGEGAQAYGHGLYFAESPNVAQQYRDQLAGDFFKTPSGALFDPTTLQHMNTRATLTRTKDLEAAIKRGMDILPNAPAATKGMLESDLAILQELKNQGGLTQAPGRMYEVNINARPDQFLDWDKPLSQQPTIVEKLKPLATSNSALADALQQFELKNTTGQVAYRNIPNERVMPSGLRVNNPSPTFASQALNEAGIPGIRYLDQGSRGTGQGTSNYVVFNDSLIDILRKYGLAGATATGVIAGATQAPSGDVY